MYSQSPLFASKGFNLDFTGFGGEAKIQTLNNIKEFGISNKYLGDKKFSYKLFINLIYLCNYSKTTNEWFYYDLKPSKLKDNLKLDSRTLKDKLNHKAYRVKEDELGRKHLYINSPKKNFTVVGREDLIKLLGLDELSIRLYLLISGWKYKKIDCLSQEQILEMFGYSSKSTSNKQKLTDSRRILEKNKLISTKKIKRGGKDFIIYYRGVRV